MRYAIVESGGKQYRAVEGRTIEVDRLAVETGKKFDFERVLFMADGDEIMVGTPTISGIEVKVTVVDHTKGPKIDRFKYRPKKRIRVRGGHRQHYTRLLVDFIGRPGEVRKVEESTPIEAEEKQAEAEIVVEAKPKAEKAPKEEKQTKAKKEAAKTSTKKAPAAKESTTTKSSSKKTDAKKK